MSPEFSLPHQLFLCCLYLSLNTDNPGKILAPFPGARTVILEIKVPVQKDPATTLSASWSHILNHTHQAFPSAFCKKNSFKNEKLLKFKNLHVFPEYKILIAHGAQ